MLGLKQVAAVAALAVAAAGASAQTTKLGGGDLGPHDPTEVGSDSIALPAYNAFDDKWTFTLSSQTTLSGYALTFDISQWSNLAGSRLSLYDSSNNVLGTVKFDGTSQHSFSFGSVAAGSYYYEVTGHLAQGATNGGYEFTSYATSVPEPASGALLLAGLGLFAVVGARRRSR